MPSARSLRALVPSLLLFGALAVAPAPALGATCGAQSTQPGQSPAASGEVCGIDFTATSGTQFSGTVATYSISGAVVNDSATIEWGDGTSSPGTFVGPRANGSGTITGTHVYAAAGNFTVRITNSATYNNAGAPINNTGTANAAVQAPDTDGDGLRDNQDNCASAANPDQANVDKDLLGDACDTDNDNDGRADTTDSCPRLASPSTDGCPNVIPVIAAPSSQSIGRTALITVRAPCSGGCARLSASGTLKYAGKRVKLAAVTVTGAAAPVALKVKIPAAQLKAVRAALRKGGKATASITVVSLTPSGRRSGQKTVSVALKR